MSYYMYLKYVYPFFIPYLPPKQYFLNPLSLLQQQSLLPVEKYITFSQYRKVPCHHHQKKPTTTIKPAHLSTNICQPEVMLKKLCNVICMQVLQVNLQSLRTKKMQSASKLNLYFLKKVTVQDFFYQVHDSLVHLFVTKILL